MLLESLQRNDLQSAFVCRGQHDRSRHSVVVRSQPVRSGHTPSVAGPEAGKAILGHRCGEVVADATLMVEKLLRHDRADRMTAPIFRSCLARTVPVEAGERVGAAGLEVAAQNVAICHQTSIAPYRGHAPFDGNQETARIYSEIGYPVAQEHIYQGWYLLNSGTRKGWERAIELFDKVAETHPDMAAGYALLAFAHWTGAAERFGSDLKYHFAKARDYAQKGLAAGDPTGLSQMVEAAILMPKGKADLALERAESAHITRPTCDLIYELEGSVRRYMGQWEKAVDLLGRAMQMTPVTKPSYPTVQAYSLYMGGRYEDAASIAETVLAHQPKNLEALLVLAAAQTELGLDRRARATSDLIRDRFPSVKVNEWLEGNPYQDTELVEHWKRDLQTAGVLEAS